MEARKPPPSQEVESASRNVFRELRQRNQRRAKVAQLLEARREHQLKVQRVASLRRARRSTQQP